MGGGREKPRGVARARGEHKEGGARGRGVDPRVEKAWTEPKQPHQPSPESTRTAKSGQRCLAKETLRSRRRVARHSARLGARDVEARDEVVVEAMDVMAIIGNRWRKAVARDE